MELSQPTRFEIIVAAENSASTAEIEKVLTEAGYHVQRTHPDLAGIQMVSEAKPDALVVNGLNEKMHAWVLNFVENNPNPPAVLVVEDSSTQKEIPLWAYDLVDSKKLSQVLRHRLDRAIRFCDMLQLSHQQSEKLGLARTQIEMVSMVDVVTGLYNRRYFERGLRESFAGAKRYQRPLTCLVLQIDNHASLKNTHGESCFNEIMDTIGQNLKQLVREADTVARIDDAVFGFILPETPSMGCKRLEERVTERLEQSTYPNQANVAFSTATSTYQDDMENPRDLLKQALDSLSA